MGAPWKKEKKKFTKSLSVTRMCAAPHEIQSELNIDRHTGNIDQPSESVVLAALMKMSDV